MKVFILCLFFGLIVATQDMASPPGLLEDCPGMNKTTTLSEDTKRSLVIRVHRPPYRALGGDQRTCRLDVRETECTTKFLDLKKRKTMVFSSGYLDASFSPIGILMVKPYLERGMNVIVFETFPVLVRSYPIAARITKPLGRLLGDYISELHRHGLPTSNLAFLGGSLGAHIVAFASQTYWETTGEKPARLTGLDPAGPCFRNLPESERMNPHVADKVDALHTNIDGFGIADTVAQIDFYANGGEYQPSALERSKFLLPCLTLCSHIRAALYWVEAVRRPAGFVAARCPTAAAARRARCPRPLLTNTLGPDTNFSRPGVYYLPTNFYPPYAKGYILPEDLRLNTYLDHIAPNEDLVV